MAINRPTANWQDPEPVHPSRELLELFPENPVFAELLVRRGIHNPRQARAFLYPGDYSPANPYDLPDMDLAVSIVLDHIRDGKKIGIWGDFDADGQTATAILYQALQTLTPEVIYQIPIRSRESHGLSLDGVESFAKAGVNLLITCDTGISENNAIRHAGDLGITTIITDHHALPGVLPEAAAIVNSQMLDANHPMQPLSGAGVAFQLIRALFVQKGMQADIDRYLDLVVIGLVADLVPLKGEARYLAQRGLQALRNTRRPGLLALFKSARINPEFLSEETISFSIAPRLNSLGRIGDANPLVELLITEDADLAEARVRQLEESNFQRKQLTEKITGAAETILNEQSALLEEPVIVLESDEWPTGVTGVVASQVSERHHKPVLIITTTPPGKPARGSVRSIPGVNVVAALAENQDMLLQYGGHPQAAGFSIEQENIPRFIRALQKSVQRSSTVSIQAALVIDAYVPLEIATLPQFVDTLSLFGPFGPENPRPCLVAGGVQVQKDIHFGKDMSHRRLDVQTIAGTRHSVIWWGGAHEPLPEPQIDLMYEVSAASFQGEATVQVTYVDSRPFTPPQSGVPQRLMKLEVFDHRRARPSRQEIAGLAYNEDTLVFAEGHVADLEELPLKNRTQLCEASTLVILTPPAGIEVLKELLNTVSPRKLHVYALESDLSNNIKFMRYLTRLLLDCIQRQQGCLSVHELAALCGHRERTIRKAIEYLALKTSLKVEEVSEDEIHINNFGERHPGQVHSSRDLDRLLEETRAFRTFFARTDLNKLLQNLAVEIERNQ